MAATTLSVVPQDTAAVLKDAGLNRKDNSSQSSRCCLCCATGKCKRCSCVLNGRNYENCIPSRLGGCMNRLSLEICDSIVDRSDQGAVCDKVSDDKLSSPLCKRSHTYFVEEKMEEAFGANLVGGYGNEGDNLWFKRWQRVIALPKRLYDVPGGAVGRHFVDLLSDEVGLLSEGTDKSERLIVCLSVLLQRDTMVQKGLDVQRPLSKRMDMWQGGCIDELLVDLDRCARKFGRLSTSKPENDHIIKVFSRLMWKGQVCSAVRWLTERASNGGVLSPLSMVDTDRTVLDVLKEQHPHPSVPVEKAFLSCDSLPPIIDVDITAAHVEKIARQIQGGAGPGGTTAILWHDCLLRYGSHSIKLRDSMAGLARRLANTIVPWNDIRALMANRLIALDKCPGVRPIGIGEAPRRILGKIIVMATRWEIEEECGVDQLCSGLQAGIEGAIHSMRELFEDNKGTGWGVLLVDAKNAFNSLNREAALWNVRVLWPQCSRFLFNTYWGYAGIIRIVV